ncbi:hypothetical protein [Peterkaempfera griseoplana]|uniref:hypothetical protein n=1 Tax=Peterkaempfera griseoplana TaxID=66896 RepID=UPI0006E1D728|nr:hypothetical protein [Peterkaempfera griseoplana]
MHHGGRWIATGVAVAVMTGLTGSAVAAGPQPAHGTAAGKPAGQCQPLAKGAGKLSDRQLAALKAKLRALGAKGVVCPGGKPGQKGPDRGKPVDDLAAKLGVSPQRLEQALIHVKQALGPKGGNPTDHPAVVAAFAHELGISTKRAAAVLRDLFGPQPGRPGPGGKPGKPGGDKPGKPGPGGKPGAPGVPAGFAQNLAEQLGVSRAAATRAAKELFALGERPGGINPRSKEFAAIAKQLGVTPKRLADALSAVKQGKDKPGSGGSKPAPGSKGAA